jgi:hypothetical protein
MPNRSVGLILGGSLLVAGAACWGLYLFAARDVGTEDGLLRNRAANPPPVATSPATPSRTEGPRVSAGAGRELAGPPGVASETVRPSDAMNSHPVSGPPPGTHEPSVAGVRPADPDAAVAEAIQRLKDNLVPVEQRREEIAAWAKRADAQAARVLMALGREDTYLNDAAVDALAAVKTPEVVAYLRARLADPNPRVVAAAARSLAQASGAESVADLAATVKANRRRPDGFQDMVCAACVESLGKTRSPDAVPVLADELAETVGASLNEEYGSRVVAALRLIGDKSGIAPLKAYQARLTSRVEEMKDNPMGAEYLRTKVREVEGAIAAISG